MKIIKRIALYFFLFLILVVSVVYLYLSSLIPQYEGEVIAKNKISEKVEVNFDQYGIPHIYASNEEDAYFALGYLIAQERLFQLEMIKRVASGRLSEVLGKDFLEIDIFFRTLGINKAAETAAEFTEKESSEDYYKAITAYLNGVNYYIETGKTPIEFTLAGIPKEKLLLKDIYLIGGYTAFSFAEGFKIDPVHTRIKNQLGEKYLTDLVINYKEGSEKIPVLKESKSLELEKLAHHVDKLIDKLPVPLWIGSNSWVIAPSKSESGSVILANDTHMAFSQPSVWYEAHLEYPGQRFYGNFLAGFPFALVGHNTYSGWGLTMFENDDVDFYKEKINPENENQFWERGQWKDFTRYTETIKIKGEKDQTIEVKATSHGPILNNAVKSLEKEEPLAVWWSFLQIKENKTNKAFYHLAKSNHITKAREAAKMIGAPGLNVMYGDKDGNIAWWASGALAIRPLNINSLFIIDGSEDKNDIIGYYAFEDNPFSENPLSGYVYSANNQPDSSAGVLYPGYYLPEDRAKSITGILNSGKFSIENFKEIINNNQTSVGHHLANDLIKSIKTNDLKFSTNEEAGLRILSEWNGDHNLYDVAPTIYYKFLSEVLKETLEDELGPETYKVLANSHTIKRSFPQLINNESSPWWDNITTQDKTETRSEIIKKAYSEAITSLEIKLGTNINEWTWKKVHTLENPHPLGKIKPLDYFFNVGPYPVPGGMEVINNLSFKLTDDDLYKVTSGPAMRRIIDFGDVENSVSVNPTGQSGYFLSPHYKDQAELFNSGSFRKQMMNKEEIKSSSKRTLIFRN
jgi:penicillin G amidase